MLNIRKTQTREKSIHKTIGTKNIINPITIKINSPVNIPAIGPMHSSHFCCRKYFKVNKNLFIFIFIFHCAASFIDLTKCHINDKNDESKDIITMIKRLK